MKIRALIVDDEPLVRRGMLRLLQNDRDIEVAGECADGESAVAAILATKPDLVFLDIQMPEVDGFMVVRQVGAEKMPVTIFVTAHDRYALRAFEVNAIDYLLKPVGQARFEKAVNRAKQRIAERSQQEASRRMIAILEQIERRNEYVDQVPIAENGRIVFVRTKDIEWIEADGNYARIHAGARTHQLRETLSCLERKLNPRDFLRIHRSTIVNVHAIKEMQKWFHGHHLVLLHSGQELRLSRYQSEISQRLGILKRH